MSDIRRTLMGMNQKFIPKWFQDAIVCWYDPKRQGCTNESLKKDPRLLDLSGNGHHVALHNFAFRDMNGLDGYWHDFSKWPVRTLDPEVLSNGHIVKINKMLTGRKAFETYVTASDKTRPYTVNKLRVKVTCNSYKYNMFMYISGPDKNSKVWISKDGIYELDAIAYPNSQTPIYWGFVWSNGEDDPDYRCKIELLPEHPGALIFDGVGSYGYADNLNFKKFQNDYTVICTRTRLPRPPKTGEYGLISKRDVNGSWGTFIIEKLSGSDEWAYSLGVRTKLPQCNYGIKETITQTKNKYQNIPLQVPDTDHAQYPDTNFLVVGGGFFESSRGVARELCHVAIYNILIFNRTLTSEEIDWVKYNLADSELPQPIAHWSAKGKTNQDADKAVLKDLTGNGHDIQLKNIAFEGMSGYGGYPLNFKYYNQAQGQITVAANRPNVMTIKSTTGKGGGMSIAYSEDPRNFINHVKLKVSGISGGSIYVGSRNYNLPSGAGADIERLYINYDGIYEISVPEGKLTSLNFGSDYQRDSCNIVIEALPEYPDALVFDGVGDFGICYDFGALTDYTVIAKRKWVSENVLNSALMSKRTPYDGDKMAFIIEKNMQYAPSFGKWNDNRITIDESYIVYQTKNNYNGKIIVSGNNVDSKCLALCAGAINTNNFDASEYSNIAFWEAYIFDKSLSVMEIQKFINNNIDKFYHTVEPEGQFLIDTVCYGDKSKGMLYPDKNYFTIHKIPIKNMQNVEWGVQGDTDSSRMGNLCFFNKSMQYITYYYQTKNPRTVLVNDKNASYISISFLKSALNKAYIKDIDSNTYIFKGSEI